MSYLDDLLGALNDFHSTLTDRWHQTIHDAVRRMEPWTPPPVHFRQNYYQSPEVWEHRRPEVQAHITFGCEGLKWFEEGAAGPVPACHGKIRDQDNPGNLTVWWEGANVPVDQDQIECGIPGLFRDAETWAYEDRTFVFDICPLFPQGDLEHLKEARGALLQMAGEFGGDFTVEASGQPGTVPSDPDFQQEITLANEVDYLFGDRNEEKDWRASWTGTAAERLSEGVFASTKPTLHNHARIANGLATLISERAHVIHTYRRNTIGLIERATASLTETDTGETDHTAKWQTVQAIGMAGAIAPPTAYVGAALILAGWLGEKWAGIERTGPTFTHHPGEVAADLYDSVLEMLEDLDQSEEDYYGDVKEFRAALNQVSSTFLELYDITENNPTGTGPHDDSFHVDIETIMQLASTNYGVAETYAGIFRKLADTDIARVNLADRHGDATPGDTEVLAIIDEFGEYLRTTAARYQLTGEQLEQAAAEYVRVDTEQYEVWERYDREFGYIGDQPRDHRVGDYFEEEQPDSPRGEQTIDPEQDADDTERPDSANDEQPSGFGTDENPEESDEEADYLEGLERVGDRRREELAQ